MPSRLIVVLVSLLATPAVIFWLWLVILPARVAVLCPEECRCETEGYYVNCSGSGLNGVSLIHPTDVRILVIDDNNITYFEKDCFVSKGLVELQILKADFCKLRKLDLGAFNDLKILLYLSIESNEISEIIPGTFEMSSLEYLKLGNNIIEHLEGEVFSGMVNLKYVHLEGNKLQYVHPDTLVRLPNLQRLFISKNSGLQIQTDRHFINSHSLKHLDISGCNISSVSGETFANVSALEWLDLSYNNLRSVDINMLTALPKLSAMYVYDNPLQCDCQLQEVWRWCQDHDIQSAYKEIAPECDTPSEVKGLWWGLLENVQCLEGNVHYYEDYNNTRFSYTLTDTETDQREKSLYIFNRPYELPVVVVFFIFGTTGNVILIIIITCNKDMRTVPNMYILNLAVSDMIILTLLIYAACANRIPIMWVRSEFMCAFLSFCYRMAGALTYYSIAVLSIQRYRVTADPLHVCLSSQPTWRATVATICGVWIVAALFAIPGARSQYLCNGHILLWRRNYYHHVTLFHLLVTCVLPLCVIAFSYLRMARHLVESSCSLSEEGQNPQLNTRKNTAKVVLGLTVVFLISYLPYHIWEYLFYFSIHLDIYTATSGDEFGWVYIVSHFHVILHLLLSISSCLNPVALFCTSVAFRREFKRYLTCSCRTKSPLTDLELSRKN